MHTKLQLYIDSKWHMTTNLTKEVPKYQNNLPIWKTRLPTNSTLEKTSKTYKSLELDTELWGPEGKILHIPLRNGLSFKKFIN
jgi:hypothetical protein